MLENKKSHTNPLQIIIYLLFLAFGIFIGNFITVTQSQDLVDLYNTDLDTDKVLHGFYDTKDIICYRTNVSRLERVDTI